MTTDEPLSDEELAVLRIVFGRSGTPAHCTEIVRLLDEHARLKASGPFSLTELEQIRDSLSRLATVADEAFGPFPVQTPEENLTAIEQGIFQQRLSRDQHERSAAEGWAKYREEKVARRAAEATVERVRAVSTKYEYGYGITPPMLALKQALSPDASTTETKR